MKDMFGNEVTVTEARAMLAKKGRKPTQPKGYASLPGTGPAGETYKLAPFHDRSQSSHNHEFAVIADMWQSLPEKYRHEPWAQSPEHLRKYPLIMWGGGEFSFHIGTVWIAIIAFLIWWGFW